MFSAVLIIPFPHSNPKAKRRSAHLLARGSGRLPLIPRFRMMARPGDALGVESWMSMQQFVRVDHGVDPLPNRRRSRC